MSDGFPGPTKETLLREQFASLALPLHRESETRHRARDPETLSPKIKIILVLHASGWKHQEIAAVTGYSYGRISQLVNSKNPTIRAFQELAQERVIEGIHDVSTQFRVYAGEMVDILVKHARNMQEPANSRLAARDILHMAGYSPVKKTATVPAMLPTEEFYNVLKHIHDSNEVILRKKEWEVQPIPTSGKSV